MAFNLVRYSQQDPQWKNDPIGGGPDTIGYIGCALTCVSMYVSGWGFTETPATLNKKLTARGGFIDEAIVWGSVTGIYPQVKSAGLTVCVSTDAPLAQIDSYLAAGNPVIVEVDYKPQAGLQTHWVLITAKKDGDYVIQDPWPNPSETTEVTLMSRFSQGQPLKRAIKAVAWYQVTGSGTGTSGTSSGSTTTTPSTPSTTPAATPVETDLVVQVV
ncbi:MAG TPA: C39 family peptidase, partial [Anaerolineales bacterium]|nr:C39 family peptidase [Anaerolineales bacterium]